MEIIQMRYGLLVLMLCLHSLAYADTNNESPVLIFVSFSMPKTSLKQWMEQAEQIHSGVVIRGLVHNSFKETIQQMAELVKDNHGGLELDPTLFQQYHINKVPAVVVRKTNACLPNQTCLDNYHVIYGDVTLDYALNKIADQQDDISTLANAALQELRVAHG